MDKKNKKTSMIVAVLMVKNESQRICQTTLESIKDSINDVFIYDTGSTDNTIEVIREFCKANNLNFHLKEGVFVNFCVSRNTMLDLADDEFKGEEKYFLLLDAHDEMQEMGKLVKFVEEYKGTCTGFYLTQRWWGGNNLDSYFNVRMVKSHKMWRYKGAVHEYIMCPGLEVDKRPEKDVIHRIEDIYIYQDRTSDDDKSANRFKRDKVLLYNEYIKDPHEPRTLFYLAQTCSCLGQMSETYKYYLLRIKEIGFYEEIYQSYFRLGDIAQNLGHDWEESMNWYMRAYQHSQRAEPLVKIAEHYREYDFQNEKKPEWHTSYMYANMACSLIFPVNQILFIDRRVYTYKRWHLLGISAFYVGRYKEGKEACLKAIEAENTELDRNNLKFYIQKELELAGGAPLSCPTLVSASFGDFEVRVKEELDIKHDRDVIFNEMLKDVIKEKKDSPYDANIVRLVLDKNTKQQAIHQEKNLNRKDKRAQMRLVAKQAKQDKKKR
jgi:glycosyltransferase involved in cell wall biosynthesis